MNHLEFAAAESAALLPTDWDYWIDAVEKLAGHDLDGDQAQDGYSLDYAFAAWKRGQTAQSYVATIPTDAAPPKSCTRCGGKLRWRADVGAWASRQPMGGWSDQCPAGETDRYHRPSDVEPYKSEA